MQHTTNWTRTLQNRGFVHSITQYAIALGQLQRVTDASCSISISISVLQNKPKNDFERIYQDFISIQRAETMISPVLLCESTIPSLTSLQVFRNSIIHTM